MPLACDPAQTFDVVLDSDQSKPKELQPTFECRYLSGREWKKAAKEYDQITQSSSSGQVIDSLFDILATGVVGWRNMTSRKGEPISYSRDALEDVLTPSEVYELLNRLLIGGKPSGADLGKSA
jgi:hypothetical protein